MIVVVARGCVGSVLLDAADGPEAEQRIPDRTALDVPVGIIAFIDAWAPGAQG